MKKTFSGYVIFFPYKLVTRGKVNHKVNTKHRKEKKEQDFGAIL